MVAAGPGVNLSTLTGIALSFGEAPTNKSNRWQIDRTPRRMHQRRTSIVLNSVSTTNRSVVSRT